MMTSTQQTGPQTGRVPSGVPTGGQFATTERAEASRPDSLDGPYRHMIEDEFDTEFGWIDGPDEVAMWLDEPTGYPANRIWTVIEDPTTGHQTLLPGSRDPEPGTDRLGWVVSVNPWPHRNLDVDWWDPADYADGDETHEASEPGLVRASAA